MTLQQLGTSSDPEKNEKKGLNIGQQNKPQKPNPNRANPNLTELKKAVSTANNPLIPPEFSTPKPQTAVPVDTSDISAKLSAIDTLLKDLSISFLIRRKEELENTLFILEKEHLNGLASDSSYLEIKSRVIKELRKLDEKLAILRYYSEQNKSFKLAIPEIEQSLEKVLSNQKTSPRQELEKSLSDLTSKYSARQISEDVYYDLKAKINLKLAGSGRF